jgi:glycosyltransferase involved in cell wall biosynthesis/SAM-dependent methyltransferase
LSRPTPEQWRRIFLDRCEGVDTGERFVPLRSRKGLTSGEHFARYLFASEFCEGKRVLDAACGTGYGSYILKILGAAEVIGVDSDPAAIELARRSYESAGLDFQVADVTARGLAFPRFDVIASFETLEHLRDPERFLENVKEWLAPGGLLLISCPHDARSPWVSPFHLRHYTYQEFHSLVSRYFPGPLPVSQVHAIASLVLPGESAAADDLALQPLVQSYFDFSKPVDRSDVFLLLCGSSTVKPQAAAVITKNLTEFLEEVYAGVHYIRERVPCLEAEVAELQSRLDQQSRQLRARSTALEDQKAYTLELQQQLEDMRHSRTWQLMLACREALGSPLKLAGLPLRIARILIDPPAAPVAAQAFGPASSPVLPQYLPHRRSAIAGWPADRPLVTVGIPCYNYGRFVREAIESVLASTFQDFEIIVVNDGSTDRQTLEVLAELEKAPPPGVRLRVVHQQNQGLAAARNKGAALAQGKYVLSLDADDRIGPTYLEKAVWVLENHPQYAFCYSLVQMFGVEDGIWKTEPFNLEKALRYNHVPTGAVFRREAWIEAGGFRDELYGQDDWNFWITLGAKGWDGCLIEEPLFFYRKHQTSMWSNIEMAERERTALTIQAMHGYITGKGDSRAAEEFHPPKDPIVRAALDRPEPVPQGNCPLVRRPHRNFGDGRPALLFAIPWMMVGGAEQVVLQIMQGLAGDYHLAAITTLDVRHNWEVEFQRVTPWIYHLAHLPVENPAAYLGDLIEAHHISGLLVSGSALAYKALPVLREREGLWTADIVHNTVPEGYLETSIQSDGYLDCHFAVGKPQRDALIRRGVHPDKIFLAPTATDTAGRFNPITYAARLPEIRHRLGLSGGEVVLTYIGRLAVEKDVPLFVQVVAEIIRRSPRRKFRAFIIGDGPERARIEHEIRVQGLQSVVELLGFSDNVAEILAASHFSFLTSRFEGSSITLLEAMSMRQIVLSTEAGSVRDVIEDGVNGFVIPTRSPADFASRVIAVLADPQREAEMRERARRTIMDRYDLAAMVRVYANAIAQGLERRQPA